MQTSAPGLFSLHAEERKFPARMDEPANASVSLVNNTFELSIGACGIRLRGVGL
jgi:hypothetical protein